MLKGFNISPAWWLSTTVTEQLQAAQACGANILRTQIPTFIWEDAPGVLPTEGGYGATWLANLGLLIAQAKELGMDFILTISSQSFVAADYAQAVRYIATTFANRLLAIEIWNEPDNSNYFSGTVEQYVTLCQLAYVEVGGGCQIIAPALASTDPTWITAAYAAGIKGYFDAISIHPYSVTFVDDEPVWAAPEECGISAIQTVMSANGDSAKPIYITEFGYPVIDTYLGVVTETQQATWMADAVNYFDNTVGVAALALYKIMDDNTEDGFGLIDSSGTQRPAYTTVQTAFSEVG